MICLMLKILIGLLNMNNEIIYLVYVYITKLNELNLIGVWC
jgi:hypothetical protein